ncbi:MAG: hypothetical protein AAB429_03590 [Patescibacteria group bacterium]
MSFRITIMSVGIKPPIYHEVRKCVDGLRPKTEVSVEEGEDPERKMFEVIFPGWKLDFRGCRGSLKDDAISAMIFNSGDGTMRIDCPKGAEEANVLVTTHCPHFYF